MLAAPVWAADDPWFAFTRDDQVGFKDARGVVKIEPKLSTGATVALRFDRIIATGEETAEGFRTYYLLKDGRQVAPDGVYYFDYEADCESEDSIRFHDRQRDKVGFLDGNGQVLISAEFDDATPLRNGMAVALKGATRACAEPGVSLKQCEHKGWQGGRSLLIDRHGKTLVERLDRERTDTLDWYSLEVSEQPPSDPRRVAFKGVDGRYYAFVDIEKDFTAWFKEEFLPHLDDAALKAHSFARIWHGQGSEPLNDWPSASADDTLRQYGPALRGRLEALRASGGYGVRQDDMGWPFEADTDPQLFDGCGNFAQWKTPKVSAMEHWQQGSFEPDKHASFDFIRTAEGYRLLSFSLPKPE
ncbi:hypothetical protein D9M71_441600 [compost metagenome]